MSRKIVLLLVVVLLIGLGLRLFAIDLVPAYDEYIQTKGVIDANVVGLEKGSEIPPLTNWTRILFTEIFGLSVQSIRLASITFGLLSILLTFLIARLLYDEKTALLAAALLVISAWHILGTTAIAFDGAFLTFYYLLTIFCFLNYYSSKNRLWLVLTGVSFGLAMLTKYNAILIIPILLVYSLLKRDSLKKILKDYAIIGLAGIIVFAAFPALSYATDFSYFITTLHHTKVFASQGLDLALLLIQYLLAAVWLGPLFIGLYLLSWFNRDKRDWLFHAWIAVVFIFFTFVVQDNFRPVERYFLVLLPALAILGSKTLLNFRFWKEKKILISSLAISFLMLFYLNLSSQTTLPFYPKTNFIDAVTSGNLNVLLPFTGDQGPIGMHVALNGILLVFALSAISLALFFIYRKPILLALFLGVALSHNFIMAEEHLLSLTHPDINKVSKETLDIADSLTLKEPIYIFRNYGYRLYLEQKYSDIRILDFDDEFNATVAQDIIQKHASVIVVDFPTLNKDSLLWKTLQDCTLIQDVKDKGTVLGHIFSC